MTTIPCFDQLPLLTPDSAWTAPTELPSIKGCKRIAIDTETCDPKLKELGPGVRRGGYICGWSLATDDGRKFYFPTRHQGGGNLDQALVWRYARSELNGFDGIVVGANLVYDLDYLANEGVTFPLVKRFHDVQVAEPLLDENKLVYSLDSLAEEYLDQKKDERLLREAAAAYGAKSSNEVKSIIWRMPAKYAGAYAESDADLPLRIMEKQLARLEADGLLELFDLESRLIPVLLAMRRRGVLVDVQGAYVVRKKLVAERAKILDEIRRHAGPNVELMAPASFAPALIERGLPVIKTAKSGQWSITKDWLNQHAGDALVDLIQAGRRVNTIITTFIDGHILSHSINNRIHCQFHQLKNDDGGTGARFASSMPNLQNVPSRDDYLAPLVRGLFLPDEGCFWERHDQCLTGDTVVVTIDGHMTIRELVKNPVPVLSSKDALSLEFQNVVAARCTGVRPVFKVTLKDGSSVRCTDNHRWIGFNNEEIYTRDLRPGTRLAHVRTGVGGRGDTPTWYIRSIHKYICKHHLVAAFEFGPRPKDHDVDHKDRDHKNWWRSNLQYKHQTINRGEAAQFWWDAATDGQRAAKTASLVKGIQDNRRSYRGEGNPNFGMKRPGVGGRPKLGEDVRCEVCQTTFYKKRNLTKRFCSTACKGTVFKRGETVHCEVCSKPFYKQLHKSTRFCSLVCRGFATQHGYDKERIMAAQNHRVVSIEPCGMEEVFDIEVANTHTFVLENGLISHNSQMEYRLNVHFARGQGAAEARAKYNNDPKTDFHNLCGLMMGIDITDKSQRKKIKNVNFAKSYGALAPKLAQGMGCSVEEAQKFVAAYEEALPFTKETFDAAQRVAGQRGNIRSILGRYARFPLWEPADNARVKRHLRKPPLPRDKAIEAYGPRLVRANTYKALNNLLQFSNADYVKKTMVDIWEAGICNVVGPFLLQVHDELDYSVPDTAEAREAVEEAKRLMTVAIKLRVPVLVEAIRGKTWGECA